MRTAITKLWIVAAALVLSMILLSGTAHSKEFDEQAQYDRAMKLIDEWRGRNDNREKAIEIAKKMLEKNPDSARAYTVLGRATWWMGYINEGTHDPGKLKEAQGYYRRAVELDPKFKEGVYFLGVSHVTAKEYGQALTISDKLKKEYPDWPRSYFIPIQVSSKTKDYATLMKQCEELTSKFPDDKDTVGYAEGQLVDAYTALGQLDKAEELYLKFIAEAPDHAWTIGNYAGFLCDYKKDYDKAIEYAQKALAIMDYGVARHTLARAAYHKGFYLHHTEKKLEEAHEYYRLAVEVYPNAIPAWQQLVICNHSLGIKNKDAERLKVAVFAGQVTKKLGVTDKAWDDYLAKVEKALAEMEQQSPQPEQPEQPQQPQG